MSIVFSCKKEDPLAIFIRRNYEAIPLKFPDRRFSPLSLLAVFNGKVRYLGSLKDEVFAKSWEVPAEETLDLEDVKNVLSSSLEIGIGLKLLQPFLSDTVGEDIAFNSDSGADVSRKQKMQVSITGAVKTFISPYNIHHNISNAEIKIPLLNVEENKGQIVLIDSALSSKRFSISFQDDNNTQAAAKLESKLAGKLSANAMRRNGSKLLIVGKKNSTFAFTCIGLEISNAGFVKGIKLPKDPTRYAAAPMAGSSVEHLYIDDDRDLTYIEDYAY